MAKKRLDRVISAIQSPSGAEKNVFFCTLSQRVLNLLFNPSFLINSFLTDKIGGGLCSRHSSQEDKIMEKFYKVIVVFSVVILAIGWVWLLKKMG